MRKLLVLVALMGAAAICSGQTVLERQLRTYLKGICLLDSPQIRKIITAPRITATGLSGTALDTLDIARMGATTGQNLTWTGVAWAPRSCCSLLDTAYNALTKIPYPSRGVKWGGPQTETTTVTSPAGSYNITFTGQRQQIFSTTSADGSITAIIRNRALAAGSNFEYTNTASDQFSRFALGGPNFSGFSAGAISTGQTWGFQNAFGSTKLYYDAGTTTGTDSYFGITYNTFSHSGIDVKNWGDTILVMSANGTGFLRPISGWDTNASDDITTSTTAGGDLAGSYPDPTVDGIQGRPVASTAPSSGQVLKWNGSAWAPAADADAQNLGLSGQSLSISGGTGVTLPIVNVSAGTGISVSIAAGNATVTNTGDTNAADDLTTSTTFSGDVSGPYNNLQIAANAVTTAEIAPNTVTGGDIAAATITAFNIANSAVGTNQIINGGVETQDILDHGIQGVDLDTAILEEYHFQDFSIPSDKMTFTGVTAGTYGIVPSSPAAFTVDNAGRLTMATQTVFGSGIYVVASGVTYLQLNELHKVARVSGAGGNLVVGLDANLHEFMEYNLICDQNDTNTIQFQVPSGSAFKFQNVLGTSVTIFTANVGAHYRVIRDGNIYIVSE